MSLETVNWLSDLVITNPVGATDPKSQGDDHIRNIKKGLKATFANFVGGAAVTLTEAQINDAARKSVVNTFTVEQIFQAAQVLLTFSETGVAADQGKWQVRVDGSQFSLFTVSDAGAATETVWRGSRSGANLSLFEIAPSRALSAIQVGGVAFSDFARLSVVNTFVANQELASTDPRLYFDDTNAGAGLRKFFIECDGGQFSINTANDSSGGVATALLITKNSSSVVTSFAITATAITLNGVNASDFARLSQSNVFTGAVQSLVTAGGTPNWSVSDGTVTTKLYAASSLGQVGTTSNHGFEVFTNNAARLTISNAGDYNFRGGIVTSSNANAGEVGPVGAPGRAISASGNTAASDAGRSVQFSGGSGQTFTLDSDPPTDSIVVLINRSGNSWTIAASGTLTFGGTTGSRTMATGSMASAFHIGSGNWYISGNNLT